MHAAFSANLAVSNAINQAVEWFFAAGPSLCKRAFKVQYLKWHPPEEGWHKLNCDGSCSVGQEGYGSISAGGTIRNDQGLWLKGFAYSLGSGTYLLAEFWAIYIDLKLAKDAGYD